MRTASFLVALLVAGSANAAGRGAPVEASNPDTSAALRAGRPRTTLSRRLPPGSTAQSDLAVEVGSAELSRPLSMRPIDQGAPSRRDKSFRQQWLLAVEGVTHAPIDMGFQAGVETPFGLRLFGGIGWVPPVYMNVLTGVAASAIADPRARAVFERADYRGTTWRLQAGVRPFKSLGLYVDAGYTRLNLSGALSLSESGVSELAALGGAYTADTTLSMWLVELGYQAQFAERMVLGLALGAVGTFDSQTTFTRQDGLGSNVLLADIAKAADGSIESYGVVPTLTLRVGFDLL